MQKTWYVIKKAGSFESQRILNLGNDSYWDSRPEQIVAGPFKKSEAEATAGQFRYEANAALREFILSQEAK